MGFWGFGFSTFCGVVGVFSVALVVVRTALFSLSVRGLLGLGLLCVVQGCVSMIKSARKNRRLCMYKDTVERIQRRG